MNKTEKEFLTELIIGNLNIKIKDNVVEPEFDPAPVIEWIEGKYERKADKFEKLKKCIKEKVRIFKFKASKILKELEVTALEIRDILKEKEVKA